MRKIRKLFLIMIIVTMLSSYLSVVGEIGNTVFATEEASATELDISNLGAESTNLKEGESEIIPSEKHVESDYLDLKSTLDNSRRYKGILIANTFLEESKKKEFAYTNELELKSKKIDETYSFVIDESEYMINSDESSISFSNYIDYKFISIPESEFRSVFGRTGYIRVINDKGEEIARIDSNIQAVDGEYKLNFVQGISNLKFEMVDFKAEENIHIMLGKIIQKNIPFTRDEIENFKELSIEDKVVINEQKTGSTASTAVTETENVFPNDLENVNAASDSNIVNQNPEAVLENSETEDKFEEDNNSQSLSLDLEDTNKYNNFLDIIRGEKEELNTSQELTLDMSEKMASSEIDIQKSDSEIVEEIQNERIVLKNAIMLNSTETKIDLEMSTKELSSLKENRVTFNVKLRSNSEKYELFKDPVIEIIFPSGIEKIDVENVNLLYKNGIDIDFWQVTKNSENENVLKIVLSGTQEEYGTGLVDGITVNFDANIEVNKMITNTKSSIKYRYTNEYASHILYQEKMLDADSVDVEFIAQNGILKSFVITDLDTNEVVLNSFNEDRRIDGIGNKEELNLNVKTTFANNYSKEVGNVVIVGKTSNPENRSMYDAKVNANAVIDGEVLINGCDAKVFYSDKENTEINSENWKESITGIGKIKEYKVVLGNDGKMQQGNSIELSYNIKLDEAISYNELIAFENDVEFYLGEEKTKDTTIFGFETEKKDISLEDLVTYSLLKKDITSDSDEVVIDNIDETKSNETFVENSADISDVLKENEIFNEIAADSTLPNENESDSTQLEEPSNEPVQESVQETNVKENPIDISSIDNLSDVLKVGSQVLIGDTEIDGESVNERQTVKVRTILKNMSSKPISNLVIEGKANNGNIYYFKTFEMMSDSTYEVVTTGKFVEDTEGTHQAEQLEIPVINPGEEKVFEYQVIVNGLENVASAQKEFYGMIIIRADGLKNTEIETKRYEIKDSDLEIRLKKGNYEDLANQYIAAGDSFNYYQAYVKNISSKEMKNVPVVFKLPSNLHLNPLTELNGLNVKEDENIDGSTVTLIVPEIEPGGERFVSLTTKVDKLPLYMSAKETTVGLSVEANGVEYIGNNLTRTISQTDTSYEASLVSDKEESSLSNGETVNYTYTIKNTGSITGHEGLDIDFPAGIVPQSARMIKEDGTTETIGVRDYTYNEEHVNGKSIDYDYSIEPGETIVFEITAVCDMTKADMEESTNVVRVSSAGESYTSTNEIDIDENIRLQREEEEIRADLDDGEEFDPMDLYGDGNTEEEMVDEENTLDGEEYAEMPDEEIECTEFENDGSDIETNDTEMTIGDENYGVSTKTEQTDETDRMYTSSEKDHQEETESERNYLIVKTVENNEIKDYTNGDILDRNLPVSTSVVQESDETTEGIIKGVVWIDSDADGYCQTDEEKIKYSTVKLYDVNKNAIISSTYTNDNGTYSFTGVKPGNYMVLYAYDADKYEFTKYFSEPVNDHATSNASQNQIIDDVKYAITDEVVVRGGDEKSINLGLKEISCLDLKVDSFVSKVTVNNNKNEEFDFDKDDLNELELNSGLGNKDVEIEYSIKVSNIGNIDGFVKQINTSIPEGFEFDEDENPNWTIQGDRVYYTGRRIALSESGEETIKIKFAGKVKNSKSVLEIDSAIGNAYSDEVKEEENTDNNRSSSTFTIRRNRYVASIIISVIIMTVIFVIAVMFLLRFGNKKWLKISTAVYILGVILTSLININEAIVYTEMMSHGTYNKSANGSNSAYENGHSIANWAAGYRMFADTNKNPGGDTVSSTTKLSGAHHNINSYMDNFYGVGTRTQLTNANLKFIRNSGWIRNQLCMHDAVISDTEGKIKGFYGYSVVSVADFGYSNQDISTINKIRGTYSSRVLLDKSSTNRSNTVATSDEAQTMAYLGYDMDQNNHGGSDVAATYLRVLRYMAHHTTTWTNVTRGGGYYSAISTAMGINVSGGWNWSQNDLGFLETAKEGFYTFYNSNSVQYYGGEREYLDIDDIVVSKVGGANPGVVANKYVGPFKVLLPRGKSGVINNQFHLELYVKDVGRYKNGYAAYKGKIYASNKKQICKLKNNSGDNAKIRDKLNNKTFYLSAADILGSKKSHLELLNGAKLRIRNSYNYYQGRLIYFFNVHEANDSDDNAQNQGVIRGRAKTKSSQTVYRITSVPTITISKNVHKIDSVEQREGEMPLAEKGCVVVYRVRIFVKGGYLKQISFTDKFRALQESGSLASITSGPASAGTADMLFHKGTKGDNTKNKVGSFTYNEEGSAFLIKGVRNTNSGLTLNGALYFYLTYTVNIDNLKNSQRIIENTVAITKTAGKTNADGSVYYDTAELAMKMYSMKLKKYITKVTNYDTTTQSLGSTIYDDNLERENYLELDKKLGPSIIDDSTTAVEDAPRDETKGPIRVDAGDQVKINLEITNSGQMGSGEYGQLKDIKFSEFYNETFFERASNVDYEIVIENEGGTEPETETASASTDGDMEGQDPMEFEDWIEYYADFFDNGTKSPTSSSSTNASPNNGNNDTNDYLIHVVDCKSSESDKSEPGYYHCTDHHGGYIDAIQEVETDYDADDFRDGDIIKIGDDWYVYIADTWYDYKSWYTEDDGSYTVNATGNTYEASLINPQPEEWGAPNVETIWDHDEQEHPEGDTEEYEEEVLDEHGQPVLDENNQPKKEKKTRTVECTHWKEVTAEHTTYYPVVSYPDGKVFITEYYRLVRRDPEGEELGEVEDDDITAYTDVEGEDGEIGQTNVDWWAVGSEDEGDDPTGPDDTNILLQYIADLQDNYEDLQIDRGNYGLTEHPVELEDKEITLDPGSRIILTLTYYTKIGGTIPLEAIPNVSLATEAHNHHNKPILDASTNLLENSSRITSAEWIKYRKYDFSVLKSVVNIEDKNGNVEPGLVDSSGDYIRTRYTTEAEKRSDEVYGETGDRVTYRIAIKNYDDGVENYNGIGSLNYGVIKKVTFIDTYSFEYYDGSIPEDTEEINSVLSFDNAKDEYDGSTGVIHDSGDTSGGWERNSVYFTYGNIIDSGEEVDIFMTFIVNRMSYDNDVIINGATIVQAYNVNNIQIYRKGSDNYINLMYIDPPVDTVEEKEAALRPKFYSEDYFILKTYHAEVVKEVVMIDGEEATSQENLTTEVGDDIVYRITVKNTGEYLDNGRSKNGIFNSVEISDLYPTDQLSYAEAEVEISSEDDVWSIVSDLEGSLRFRNTNGIGLGEESSFELTLRNIYRSLEDGQWIVNTARITEDDAVKNRNDINIWSVLNGDLDDDALIEYLTYHMEFRKYIETGHGYFSEEIEGLRYREDLSNKEKYDLPIVHDKNDTDTYIIRLKDTGRTRLYKADIEDILETDLTFYEYAGENYIASAIVHKAEGTAVNVKSLFVQRESTTNRMESMYNSVLWPGDELWITINVRVDKSNLYLWNLENEANVPSIRNKHNIEIRLTDETPNDIMNLDVYKNKEYIRMDELPTTGYVWKDVNKDGVMDSDEPKISGIKVALIDATTPKVAYTTTDGTGKYSFPATNGTEVNFVEGRNSIIKMVNDGSRVIKATERNQITGNYYLPGKYDEYKTEEEKELTSEYIDYYIEFEYNGARYKATNNYASDDHLNKSDYSMMEAYHTDSNATEFHNMRENFEKRLETINYNNTVSSRDTGNVSEKLFYDKSGHNSIISDDLSDDKNKVLRMQAYSFVIGPETNNVSGRNDISAAANNGDSGNIKFLWLNKKNGATDNSCYTGETDYLKEINLGLKVQEFDLTLEKDLYSIRTTVNGEAVVYDYDQGNNGAQRSDYVGNYATGGRETGGTFTTRDYDFKFYSSDYNYRSTQYKNAEVVDYKTNTELGAEITYKITIKNDKTNVDDDRDHLYAVVNEITDYYPQEFIAYDPSANTKTERLFSKGASSTADQLSDFEGVPITEAYYYDDDTDHTTGKNNLTISSTTSHPISYNGVEATTDDLANQNKSFEGYNKLYITGLGGFKLDWNDSKNIYIKYTLDKDTSVRNNLKISNGKTISEVNSYSTYEDSTGTNPAGYIDINSNPGNLAFNTTSGRFDDDLFMTSEGFKQHENDKYKTGVAMTVDSTTPPTTTTPPTLDPPTTTVTVNDKERAITGMVWDDARSETAGADNEAQYLGDGIYDKNKSKSSHARKNSLFDENSSFFVRNSIGGYTSAYFNNELEDKDNVVRGVKVRLIELIAIGDRIYEETINTSSISQLIATTNNSGVFRIQGFIPGQYVVRYDYGYNTNNDTLRANMVVYNGQDYKSTTFNENLDRAEIRDTTNVNSTAGDEVLRALTGKSRAINTTTVDFADRYSDARDDAIRRLDVNSYSEYMNNTKSNILQTAKTKASGTGSNLVESNKNILLEKTHMYADTPTFPVRIEDDTYESTTTHYAFGYHQNIMYTTTRYELNDIDFGVEYRPELDIELDKFITEIKVKTSSGKVLYDLKYDRIKENGANKIVGTSLNESISVGLAEAQRLDNDIHRNVKGFVYLNVDADTMQGTQVEISYVLGVNNISEIDRIGSAYRTLLYESAGIAVGGGYAEDGYEGTGYEPNGAGSEVMHYRTSATARNILDEAFNEESRNTSGVKVADSGRLASNGDFVVRKNTVRTSDGYYGLYLGNTYYTGNPEGRSTSYATGDEIAMVKIDNILDYVDNDMVFEQSKNSSENNYWRATTAQELGARGFIDERIFNKEQSPTLGRLILSLLDNKGRKYDTDLNNSRLALVVDDSGKDGADPNMKNREITRFLEPEKYDAMNSAASIDINTSKTISSEADSNNLSYDNVAEIVEYRNETGRVSTLDSHSKKSSDGGEGDSVSRNEFDPGRSSSITVGNAYLGIMDDTSYGDSNSKTDEPDTAMTQTVTLVPPTGRYKLTYYLRTHRDLLGIVETTVGLMVCIPIAVFSIKKAKARKKIYK